MPKVSKYIENKSHVLFDMYRQLSDIKGGKAYKEGDTAVVRSRVARREGRWHGLWAVAVSGTGGVAVAAQLCNHLSATHLIPPNPPIPPSPLSPTRPPRYAPPPCPPPHPPTWQGDSVQKSIDAFVARHNTSKKSPLRVPQLQLPMCLA